METETPETEYFNTDPTWLDYVGTLEPVIRKIAQKLTSDDDLQEDCKQEARMALCTIRPEKIVGNRDAYVRNVIRNRMLKYLSSYNTGDWYSGRTTYRESEDGSTIRRYVPPRFASFDLLADEFGMEVDEHGAVSWVARDDGLSNDERANVKGPDLETVANDARANETELIDALYLEAMMAKLKRSQAESIRNYLDGTGAFPYIAVHTLACVEGAKAKCSSCGQTKEASDFLAVQWSTDQECSVCVYGPDACEAPSARQYTRKCRCGACRAANAKYKSEWKLERTGREPRPARPKREPAHGEYGYRKRGCRCPTCCEAYERYKARQRLRTRRKAEAEGRIYTPRRNAA